MSAKSKYRFEVFVRGVRTCFGSYPACGSANLFAPSAALLAKGGLRTCLTDCELLAEQPENLKRMEANGELAPIPPLPDA